MRQSALVVGDIVSGLRVDSFDTTRSPQGKSVREYTLVCPNCEWKLVTKQIGYLKKRIIGCEQCRPPKKHTGIYVVESFFYIKVKSNAQHRGLNFDMTFEEFKNALSNECHYCGGPGQERWNASKDEVRIYCGFDRVDNLKGYVLSNVVPCCYSCNKAKGTKTYEEFIEWLDSLVAFRKDIK